MNGLRHLKFNLSTTRLLLLVGLGVGLCVLFVVTYMAAPRMARALNNIESYAVYYGVGEADALAEHDLAIVQPNTLSDTELNSLQKSGTQVVAYLSIGEVEPNRPWFSDGRVPQDWLVGYNEAWDSYHVDVRQEGWQDLLVEIAGDYLDMGFDGIFMDTVDTALLYPDTEYATLNLIRNLRRAYPRTILIQNRGLPIIHDSQQYVDALMLESISTRYDFEEESYARADPSFEATQAARIMQDTGLRVLALEYAPTDNPALARDALQSARNYGFVPAVSTINLTDLPDYGFDDARADPRISDFSLQGSAEKRRLEVRLENVGLRPATDVSVSLHSRERKVASIRYAELASGEDVLWEFAWDGSQTQNLEVRLSAAEDARSDNNSLRLDADVAQEPLLSADEQRRRPVSNGPLLSAAVLSDEVVIDGSLEDWHNAACTTLGEAGQINFQTGSWEGPDDLSGELCFYWDEESLYLSADVVDDRLEQRYTGTDLWHGDHVELWIDTQLQLDFDSERESEDDFQFGFSPGNFADVAPDVYLWTPTAPRERYDSRIDYAAVQTDKGYRLEVKLPASVLVGLRLEPEHAVGLSVAISDTDTPGSAEQETMLATAPGLRWGVPSTFNTLILSAESLAEN